MAVLVLWDIACNFWWWCLFFVGFFATEDTEDHRVKREKQKERKAKREKGRSEELKEKV